MQVLLALALLLPQDVHANRLTRLEADAGWRLLFDGETRDGWRRFGGEDFPDTGWEIVDGCLHLKAGERGGDLVATDTFENFELELEWKVAPGSNSGIKYRVPDPGKPGAMLGPEYQVLDDTPDTAPKHTTGALYDVVPPGEKEPRPAGEWNATRIVARGDRIEHWLNGKRLLVVDQASDTWTQAIAASKFSKVAGFARGRGHVGLQDHGGEVWYRSIRIRDWDDLPGEEVVLFNGKNLDGWLALGDAKYTVDDGCILGEVGGGGQSFLMTGYDSAGTHRPREFGDFILEVDLKNELPGNSGIQIRSHEHLGRLRGYQIEIDPSDRAWSGGLYDEARRGWLDDLSDNELARRAFRNGEWNTYRIECVGPSIKTWVNGVPAADYLDTMDAEGVIGLQVHSGNNTRVRWRDFRMRQLGRHDKWEVRLLTRLFDEMRLQGLTISGGTFVRGEGEAWVDLQETWRDFVLRGKLATNGGPALFAMVPRGSSLPSECATSEPLSKGMHEFEVACFGSRLVVRLDGKTLADVRDTDIADGGSVRLGSRHEGETRISLEGCELLR